MALHVELAGACLSVGGTSGAEFLSGAASLRDLSEDLLLLQLRPPMTLSHQTFARLLKVFWFTSYASLNRVVVRETEVQQQQQQLSVFREDGSRHRKTKKQARKKVVLCP